MNANLPSEPSEKQVKETAYLLYLASGCIPGHDLENWLLAREKIVAQQLATVENTPRSARPALHFPLNANATRGPFESFGSFESRN